MQNNTKFEAISLDNLNTVTGGYHDPVEPSPEKKSLLEREGERLRKRSPIVGPIRF